MPASDVLIAVLAAGAGSRFGGDKLAAPCAGKPLGQWALSSALAVGPPVVWIGSEASLAIAEGRCETVPNPSPERGIASSLALAAELAQSRGAQSLLVMLADMPLVDVHLLTDLNELGAPAACTHPDGSPGVPALLPASLFPQLLAQHGNRGAGSLLRQLDGLNLLEPGEHRLLDVDTQADLQLAERLLARR